MITVLGAGGIVSTELIKLFTARKQPFRLVSRHVRPTPVVLEVVEADLCNKERTIGAVSGSSLVYLSVGLKYHHKVWAEKWPVIIIMANTIEACKRASAKLVFFYYLYVYGKVDGAMTEETPFNPCSKKGEIRAGIATSLINEWNAGGLAGMIARAADFYGLGATNGLPNILVFEPLSKNRKASCAGK